jgi:hypothetical protein
MKNPTWICSLYLDLTIVVPVKQMINAIVTMGDKAVQ